MYCGYIDLTHYFLGKVLACIVYVFENELKKTETWVFYRFYADINTTVESQKQHLTLRNSLQRQVWRQSREFILIVAAGKNLNINDSLLMCTLII